MSPLPERPVIFPPSALYHLETTHCFEDAPTGTVQRYPWKTMKKAYSMPTTDFNICYDCFNTTFATNSFWTVNSSKTKSLSCQTYNGFPGYTVTLCGRIKKNIISKIEIFVKLFCDMSFVLKPYTLNYEFLYMSQKDKQDMV